MKPIANVLKRGAAAGQGRRCDDVPALTRVTAVRATANDEAAELLPYGDGGFTASLRGILGRSGVGFNVHGDYKIDIDDDQWAQVVQADNNAKFMRNKSWPFWKDWKCIFGKDRATGGGTEPVEKATAEVRSQLAGGSQCNQKDYHPSFEDFLGDELPNLTPESEHQNSSSAHNDQPESTTKSGALKRKLNPSDTSLMEFLGNLHAEINSRLDVISSRIGYEFDLGKARQEVFDKLGGVDRLTLDKRYDLCDILGDKPQRLEVFMGMPTNARVRAQAYSAQPWNNLKCYL
ncbi:hypothetical protein AAHA92_06245 [Salvia divinorum]|uniref:Uncharacterized protein n=1 Tax=Salvia divinorum TaxID=28513 RepID=A0ABD1I642_SALDI